jgi:hypothetical protein
MLNAMIDVLQAVLLLWIGYDQFRMKNAMKQAGLLPA